MRQLSSYIGEELILIQPSFFKREFEFHSSTELLAKMYYPNFFSLTAVVEGFADKYELFKPSFWKSEIAIRKFGYDMPVASLTTNFFSTKGTIDLQNGKKILLKLGAFKKVCQIFSESEELLMIFQSKISFKDKTIVSVQKSSTLIDENPWIVMMILYLLLQNRKNGAAS